MRIETIACNQCGAPLSVPGAAQFVTCNHCGASLAVRRSESVTYTEVVAKLVENTSKLAKEVAHLRYQSELARIDREWEMERRRYLVERKHGPPTEPSHFGAVIAGGSFAFVGIIACIVAATHDGPSLFAVFGTFSVGIGILGMTLGVKKAARFERAKAAYRSRRAQLKVEDFIERDDALQTETDEIPPLR